MLWLASAALAASASAPQGTASAGASAQARATVRIVQAVTLKMSGEPNAQAPRPRMATVRTEGEPRRVRLIEFE